MTNLELARKALNELADESFLINVSTYSGKCDAWSSDEMDDDSYVDISREAMLRTLSGTSFGKKHPEIFEGLELGDVTAETELSYEAFGIAFPVDSPYATVGEHGTVPEELLDLAERLSATKNSLEPISDELKKQILEIKDSEYTFHFTITSGGYEFDSDVEEKISLTASQARGLLYAYLEEDDDLFKGIDYEHFGWDVEEFIDNKAEEKGFAVDSAIDYMSLDYDCPQFDDYLNQWLHLLDGIMDGSVTEENLDSYMPIVDDNLGREEEDDNVEEDEETDN